MTHPTINIPELLNGDVIRLRYVNRFSTCRVTKPETVAEHSYFAALYAMFVADWVCMYQRDWSRATRTSFTKQCVCRALLHDVEECVTGDIPRTVKHSTPELHDVVDKTAHVCARRVFETITCDVRYADILYGTWSNAKDATQVGLVVRFADFLSAVSYIVQELSGNNTSMLEHVSTIHQYADKFRSREYDFIAPLVDVALTELARYFPDPSE